MPEKRFLVTRDDQLLLHLGRILAGGWAAAAVLGFYFVLFLVTVLRFPYFSPSATVDEQLAYYQVARNFNEYGFLNSMFLHDLSSSSRPEHHPFIYNHMPPGPEIVVALLTRVVGENFAMVRMVLAVIFMLGMLCFFRVASMILGAAGLVGAGFAVFLIDPQAVMRIIDHPAYSPFPLLAFFPLVALQAYYDRASRWWFGLAMVAILIASVYLVYQQLVMVLVSWTVLGLLRIVKIEPRHLAVIVGVVILGVFLHFLQSVILLGPSVFVRELQLTLANRMFAVPIGEDLRAFYQSIGVVHQGFHQLDLAALWEILRRSLYILGSRGLTRAWLLVVAVVLAIVILRVSGFDRSAGTMRITRGGATEMVRYFGGLIVWALTAIMVPLLLFPAYAVSYQLSGANLFFLAIVGMAGVAYVLREIVQGLSRGVMRDRLGWPDLRNVGMICVWLIVVIGIVDVGAKVSKAYGRGLRVAVNRSVGAVPQWQGQLVDALQPLRGKVVMTNIFPSVVSFFTHEATLGGCELEAFPSSRPLNHLTNGDLEAWSEGGSTPDGWWVAGDGLVFERDPTSVRGGSSSGRLKTSNGKIGRLSQRIGLPRQPERYRVVASFWLKATSSGRVKVYLAGAERKFSPYHPGNENWELLSIESEFPANVVTPPVFEVGVQIDAGVPITVNVDMASVYVSSLDGLDQAERSARVHRTTTGAPISSSVVMRDARPDGADPSKCHAVWIRVHSPDALPRPTHYVLFRGLYTGFTLCREAECLDRMERYIASRFPRIFANELCTVFLLDGVDRSGEKR